jgi:uncharacterized protein (TIGR03083 family)
VSAAGTGGGLDFIEQVESIAAESRRLADVVGSSDLNAVVPSTPKWAIRDLAHHIGVVQWYWAQNVRAGDVENRSGGELTPLPVDADLQAWLGWCTYSLLRALREAGPDAPCWTWWPSPQTAGAVCRHQAQEVAVHRWDAEGASGSSVPLTPALAADGVPEFIEIMIGSDARSLTGTVTLTGIDTGNSWTVGGASTGGGEGSARARTAELRATESDLVLMLYRRLPVPDEDVAGDPMLVAAMLSLADTS